MNFDIFIHISPPIPYPVEYWFLSYLPKCCWPIKLKDSLKCSLNKEVSEV